MNYLIMQMLNYYEERVRNYGDYEYYCAKDDFDLER